MYGPSLLLPSSLLPGLGTWHNWVKCHAFLKILEVGMRMKMHSFSSRLKWEHTQLQSYRCPIFCHVDQRSEVRQFDEREKIDPKQGMREEVEGKSLDCHFTPYSRCSEDLTVLPSWISARYSCRL